MSPGAIAPIPNHRLPIPAGGARRDRTDDLMLAKHALSQLSYGPGDSHQFAVIGKSRFRSPQTDHRLVGLGGLEPPTSRLSSARSNQLSYKPEGSNRLAVIGDRKYSDHRSPSTDHRSEEREAKGAVSRKRGRDLGRLIPNRTTRHVDARTRVLRPLSAVLRIQKGGDPAAGSPTATLLRLHPSR
jgi:hypothetical protein